LRSLPEAGKERGRIMKAFKALLVEATTTAIEMAQNGDGRHGAEAKLPPHGFLDIEFFNEHVAVTLRREDGKELSASMTVGELKNLAQYLSEVLKTVKA